MPTKTAKAEVEAGNKKVVKRSTKKLVPDAVEIVSECNGDSTNVQGEHAMNTENATATATVDNTTATAAAAPEASTKKRSSGPRPVLPLAHAFDADVINAAFAASFGGQLLEAMQEVAAGTVVNAATPLITVKYVQDTLHTQELSQTFAVIMGTGFPEGFSILEMLNPAADVPNTDKLKEALDMFKASSALS